MSQRIDSIHRPIPQDEIENVFTGKVTAFLIVLAVIVLLFAAVAIVVPRSNPSIETTEVASMVATNPELMAAGHYARETAKRSEAAFLSANPELMATRIHAEAAYADSDESPALAANPEIIVFQHFVSKDAMD